MQKKSDKELKNASVPEQVSPFAMSDKGSYDDGLDAAFAPESEGFRAFFTTSAAVVPKEMQEETAAKKNGLASKSRKEKKPSLFSKARGMFSTSIPYDDEDEEEDEGVFFPTQPAAPVKHTPEQKKSAQSVKSDLFGSYAVEEVFDDSAVKTQGGKVHFLSPAEMAAAKAAPAPAPVKSAPAPVKPAPAPVKPAPAPVKPAPVVAKEVEKFAPAVAKKVEKSTPIKEVPVKAAEKPVEKPAAPAVSPVEKLMEEVAQVKAAEKNKTALVAAEKATEVQKAVPVAVEKAAEVQKAAPVAVEKAAEVQKVAPVAAEKAAEVQKTAPVAAEKAAEVPKAAPVAVEKAPEEAAAPQAPVQPVRPAFTPDPTEAIVNAILLERHKAVASAPVASTTVPAASAAVVVAATASEKEPSGVAFSANAQSDAEALSSNMGVNAEALPEEDEAETAPKENIFAAKFAQATEKVAGWKQALAQKFAARKEEEPAEIALEEVELDVFSAQAQPTDAVSWFGADADVEPAQAASATPQTDTENAPAAQADGWFAADVAASAPDEENDQIIANVQSAFAARAAQQGGVAAPEHAVMPNAVELAPVAERAPETTAPEAVLASAPEIMPEAAASMEAPEATTSAQAEEIVLEATALTEAEAASAQAPEATTSAQAEEIALEAAALTEAEAASSQAPEATTSAQAPEATTSAQAPETAQAPQATIATETPSTPEATPASEIAPAPAAITPSMAPVGEITLETRAPAPQPEPDLFAKQPHHDYCMFDQMADEVAAEEQRGEIVFVGAASLDAASAIDPMAATTAAATAAAGTSATTTAAGANAAATAAAIAFAVAGATATTMQDAAEAMPSEMAPAPAPSTTTKVANFFTNLFDDGEEDPVAQDENAPESSLLDDTLLGDRAQNSETPFEETPARPTFQTEHEPLPEDAEGIQFGLSGMRVKLLVRVFTTGVFAVALFMLGLMGQGVLHPVSAIDPTSAPVPFLLVNLLLLLAAAGVSYPVLIEGVLGVWRKPSADTPAALATLAALVQLLMCLTFASQFDAASMTMFSALAGIALFTNALGNLVMQGVIQANFNHCNTGVPHQLAYKLMARDPLRTLVGDMPIDDPALLVSRPVGQMQGFLEKSFAPRTSDLRARWISYGLLGAAVLACLISLLLGQSNLAAISSFAAVLCIGAPLSATLVSALPSALLQRACARVGAVVPGWQSIETLGETNVIAVEASDLFPPLCAQFYGMKTFQKERIDLAILYAASILAQHGGTLQNIFSGMIENKSNILYPVKDLVHEEGKGFIGWCENYRVILGTRAFLQAEGVALPAMDNEARYSKDGARQVLYLAVSGEIYAMFLVGYRGEKSVARALRILRKEHIRLLVHSTDPTLTARRIEEIYHLPEGFITLVRTPQVAALAQSTDYRAQADGTLLHLGFVSLVGGLKAASGAEQAERSASAIQLIWAGFSIALSLFLCITGGLMQVALIAIFLYQAAWSVLSLGVVLTKKFD